MDCAIIEMGSRRHERFKGLWDTGTSTTVITPEVADKLGIVPDKEHSMGLHGLGGTTDAPTIVAAIGFPNGQAFGPIEMAVHKLPSTDVLIGMDVISIGTLTIRRKPDGGTLFTFDMNI